MRWCKERKVAGQMSPVSGCVTCPVQEVALTWKCSWSETEYDQKYMYHTLVHQIHVIQYKWEAAHWGSAISHWGGGESMLQNVLGKTIGEMKKTNRGSPSERNFFFHFAPRSPPDD